MEFNNNYNNKNIYSVNQSRNRFKSVSNVFVNKLTQRSNSNINSSNSKKTGAFEESIINLTNISKRMNSYSNKQEIKNHRFSPNNNIQSHQSQEFSMKDIKDKNEINGNYTNINISIVNPNFSTNNFDSNNSPTNLGNNRLNVNIINNTLLSFKESGNNIETEENKSISKNECKNKMIASIYKDYLENKSNEETFSENFKDELKKSKFKEYLKKHKIIQYEFNNKGNISGFSAYLYQNEEKINKDKICLNLNIIKLNLNEYDNEKVINNNYHLINLFSLFSGGEKDDNNELPKYLNNNLKDIILKDKEIISNPKNAIKNCFIKCELDFNNKFVEDKFLNKYKNNINEGNIKIPSSSLFVLLIIDDIFYIGNIGKSISIISSNYSKKINYICKEYIYKEIYTNFYYNGKRKNINALFNYNSNDEINDNNEISEYSNSQIFFNNSNMNININMNNNFEYFTNNIINSNFLRVFPGKALYDFLSVDNNNNNLNKKSNNKKPTRNRPSRRFSTTFSHLISLNSEKVKNKSLKINNYFKDNSNNSKQKNSNSIKEKDNLFNLGPQYSFNNTQNYNSFYRPSFISHNSYKKIFPENKIISSYPDILSFKYQNCHDFILIGSKIIFEKLTLDKICKSVYETMRKCIRKHRSFEIFLGCVVKDIIKKCISMGVKSIISCIFICFDKIKKLYLKQDINNIKSILISFYLTANKSQGEIYDDFLSLDLINLEKANNYNDIFSKELEKKNKYKKHFSTNIINTSEIKKKYDENNKNKNEEIKIKKKVKNMRKKCCCLIY